MSQIIDTPIVPVEDFCDFEFGACDTLITQHEVVCHAPSSAKSWAEERCTFISTREEQLFNKCFGWDFYCALLADRCIYVLEGGTIPAGGIEYKAFREATPYPVSTIVLHQGGLYEVTRATDGTQIPARPDYFKKARKFKKPEYNYLWERYLCKLLAFSVMHVSVMYRLVKDTNQGLVKNYTDGKSVPATLKELYALKDELLGDLDDIIENMENFMKRHPQCFSLYKGLKKCEKGCARKRKNFGFNA